MQWLAVTVLALAGGMLYLFDPIHFVPFTGGLLVLLAWLSIFYSEHIGARDETGEPNVGLVVLVLNVQACLLGVATLTLPNWAVVGTTVAAVRAKTRPMGFHGKAIFQGRSLVTANCEHNGLRRS